jgi:chromate transport protein ChrA
MKAAKITAFIAFTLHSLFAVYSVITFLKLSETFQELNIKTPFPWAILIPAIFAVGSLIYWFYLRNKESKRETVKFALWLSIALLLIPWLFFYWLIIISTIQPLYNLMGNWAY